MKKLINSFAALLLAILGVTTFNSCADCSTVICNNGSCSNGICVCAANSGYEKRGTGCVGVNIDYISVDSSFITTVTRVDSNGNSFPNLNNVGYQVYPSSVSPYVFALKRFNGLNDNDINFTIQSNNYRLLIPQTVVTTAGYTYSVSGEKVGTQITLVITDVVSGITYTLTYS